MTKLRFDKAGIKYQEINLDERPEQAEEIKKLGYSSLPVVISGAYSWCGFLPANIDLTIKQTKAALPQ